MPASRGRHVEGSQAMTLPQNTQRCDVIVARPPGLACTSRPHGYRASKVQPSQARKCSLLTGPPPKPPPLYLTRHTVPVALEPLHELIVVLKLALAQCCDVEGLRKWGGGGGRPVVPPPLRSRRRPRTRLDAATGGLAARAPMPTLRTLSIPCLVNACCSSL